MRTALIPGTFDPFTKGHENLVRRALTLFDRVIVLVADNIRKDTLFTAEERKRLIEQSLPGLDGLEVDIFSGLTVDYARKRGVSAIVRGVRSVPDFSYEFEIAMNNLMLCPGVEEVFLPSDPKYFIVRSSQIKELAAFGADFSALVPPPVHEALKARLGQ